MNLEFFDPEKSFWTLNSAYCYFIRCKKQILMVSQPMSSYYWVCLDHRIRWCSRDTQTYCA